jgi:cyclophilin family peptidyl-prolyl cis-trans isomerase
MRAVALLLAVLLLAVAAACGGDDEAADATTTEPATETTTTAASGDCESVEEPAPREPESREAPTEALDEGTSYGLVFETSCGSFTVALDLETAPQTVASLVALARDGYFDDTTFHRVVPGFVIQGGDPTATGAGGPGYSTVDVPPSDARYTKGVVAMAKTQAEPAGTSGSQFFVVTADDAGLPPEYAVVGEVTEGMDTVERIGALGVQDGPPSQPVVVSSVTVEES